MKLETSKGKIFDVSFAAVAGTISRDFLIQLNDDRDISEISKDFDNTDWFKWTDSSDHEHQISGYSKIKGISRAQYDVDPSFVQILMGKDR